MEQNSEEHGKRCATSDHPQSRLPTAHRDSAGNLMDLPLCWQQPGKSPGDQLCPREEMPAFFSGLALLGHDSLVEVGKPKEAGVSHHLSVRYTGSINIK